MAKCSHCSGIGHRTYTCPQRPLKPEPIVRVRIEHPTLGESKRGQVRCGRCTELGHKTKYCHMPPMEITQKQRYRKEYIEWLSEEVGLDDPMIHPSQIPKGYSQHYEDGKWKIILGRRGRLSTSDHIDNDTQVL